MFPPWHACTAPKHVKLTSCVCYCDTRSVHCAPPSICSTLQRPCLPICLCCHSAAATGSVMHASPLPIAGACTTLHALLLILLLQVRSSSARPPRRVAACTCKPALMACMAQGLNVQAAPALPRSSSKACEDISTQLASQPLKCSWRGSRSQRGRDESGTLKEPAAGACALASAAAAEADSAAGGAGRQFGAKHLHAPRQRPARLR